MSPQGAAGKLYERGDISTGKATQLLGTSRRAFLDILGPYQTIIDLPQADVYPEPVEEYAYVASGLFYGIQMHGLFAAL
jgi:hypothetical protein